VNKKMAAFNTDQARFNMVEQQIRTWEVLDQDVLDLLYAVHREDFVPAEYRDIAFSDLEIPLRRNAAPNEHMWAPKVEARVVQDLAIKRTDRVLEVGSGSGYLAALLAHRAQQVHSVEISPELAALATANLARADIENVQVEHGDAARGWALHAPYDVIVVTSSMPVLPQEFLSQLRPGGRIFAIIGDPPVMEGRIVTCGPVGAFVQRDLFETCLAPLSNALQPERFRF
jgi:protein-L-isoaspartate(D-aspartate) O-methyltransferase